MKGLGKKIAVATVLGVLVYAAMALWGDVHKLREHLSAFAWWTFAGALGLAFGNYLFRFLKWQYYLRLLGIGANKPGEPFRPVPAAESFTIFVSGFVMSVTPGKAGEVFKSALLASARGVPIARTAPIVVAERLTDLVALAMMVAVGSAYFPGGMYWALAASGVVLVLLAFVAVRPLAHGMISLVGRFGFGKKLAPRLHEAYDSLRTLTAPGALAMPVAVSVAAWACECTALWLVLRGLGQDVSLFLAYFVYATATIAGALAMLPGGLGGTEVTMIALLGELTHHAIDKSTAGAATLLVRLATLWFAVVVGVVALAIFRRRYDRQATVTTSAGQDAPAERPAATATS